MHKFIIILLSLFIISCGNKKPNKLPEGVVDKSQYPFPPSDEYEYPCITEESPLLCELDKIIERNDDKDLMVPEND
mgnify:CR=1 FL=1|tara:strand:- start:593 stop:820 length:228 start_codon:yes stop_codon:yes gene_type:complete